MSEAVFGVVLTDAPTESDYSMTAKQVGYVSTMATFFVAGWVSPALAYLDTGAGSINVQGIIGGFAVATVVIGIYLSKTVALFAGKRGAKLEEDGHTNKE